MAVTVNLLSSGTYATSSTTKVSASYAPTAGSMLVLIIACDNNGTSGVSSLSAPSNDTAGRVWSSFMSTVNYTPGSIAADGATLGVWYCKATAATAATTTMNFSPATTRVCYQILELKNWPGSSMGVGTQNTTGSTASPSASDIYAAGTIDDVSIGIWAREGFEAVTADADSTNGVSWSAGVDATTGTSHAASMGLYTQSKVGNLSTTPSSNTFNPTGTLSDGICACLALLPLTAGSVPPSGLAPVFTVSNAVYLSWTGGFDHWAVTGYVLEYRETVGPGAWKVAPTFGTGTTTVGVTGLTNGVSYEFRVSRTNSYGTSPVSATSAAATPQGPPYPQKGTKQAIHRATVR
jgi:hypothetical protein